MRRLDWVEEVPGLDTPIIELVRQAIRKGPDFARQAPRLSPRYPDYPAYDLLRSVDRVVFIRRLIPQAVGQFRARVEGEEKEGA
jgi:hypothetical protein